MVERLQPGDIVLTATSGKVGKVVRRATKGEVSHAMICVQHGSTIDSTDGGVQASNIQRELYGAEDTVIVLRLRQPPDLLALLAIIEFARSEIGTRYSKIEAARTVIGGPKPRSKQMFCSRLVARAYAAAGILLVHDPDYCSPDDLRVSSLLVEVPDMLEVVRERELEAWATRPNPIAEMQNAQNRILEVARALDPAIENFNDLDAFVQAQPQHDDAIAEAYRTTGYLDIFRNDIAVNPWHYDLAEMEAVTHDPTVDELRAYCISTIREFHTGGLRFAVNLAHYERAMQASPRRTTAQLVQLYRQLVQNDHMRRSVALEWLRRRYPADAKAEMQRIVPHTELWFSMVDRVEPQLGIIARINIEATGSAAGCSSCGDPAHDFMIVNGAKAMPGVPSLRLCPDCAAIRSGFGEILMPIDD
ncbi:YiiX/YebB-like N1pC/P60 family cysteine hydrolase [Novosphingobium sp. CCH12-A3]|uniref:YiiX/YebB-like N1pC/P60 family cysteine hydrolase n=1 Tax=Novosphingobium sp. CCH12-A3 TaxID=1768752 RepID=UPI000781A050|nr:YiiX/YebB-like N1pC/P60 family cysteine hydrolase [Novosphingobium sp. CCH12-A3]